MRKEIRAAKQCGVDGVVLGILHANHKIDRERSAALVELAYPMPVTFHRAFDKVPKLGEALEDVIQTGAARILTSGGQPQAVQALPDLAQLVQAAQRRISLMLCGGIHPQNILEVVHSTGAREVHSSVGTSGSGAPVDPWGDGQDGSNLEPNFFERRVAILVSLLRQHEEPGETTAVAPAHGG
jgi:copper homeostasis protein